MGLLLSAPVLAGKESPLDKQALSFAKPLLERYVVRCGNAHYVKRIFIGTYDFKIFQLNGTPSLAAKPGQVGEADRLNGLEWEGAAVYRLNTRAVKGLGEKQWSDRYSSTGQPVKDPEIWVQKVAGKWKTKFKDPSEQWGFDYGPITCADVKGGG